MTTVFWLANLAFVAAVAMLASVARAQGSSGSTVSTCSNQQDCNGNAVSTFGYPPYCRCNCMANFSGSACSRCSSGYSPTLYGTNGVPTVCVWQCSVEENCNGVATFVSGNVNSGCFCTCLYGWAGSQCERCASGFSGYPVCILQVSATPVVKIVGIVLGVGAFVAIVIVVAIVRRRRRVQYVVVAQQGVPGPYGYGGTQQPSTAQQPFVCAV